ncbi:hypothetical protein [Hymenobacter tenuis]
MRILPVLLAALALLTSASAKAQRRATGNLGLLPEVQAEVALSGDDYVLLALRAPIQTGTFRGTQLDQVGVRVGYESFWSDQWSWGAELRADSYDTYRSSDATDIQVDIRPQVFLRHWATLGSVNFRQRLGLEYWIPGETGPQSRALANLRLDVDKVFALNERVALRPRISVEPQAYLRFQRDEDELKERVIDFSSLRGEVGVRLSPRIDFTPWFAWQSNYYFSLTQTDSNGTITIPGGKGRYTQPILGLDLRMTLGGNAQNADRRQLPTQH